MFPQDEVTRENAGITGFLVRVFLITQKFPYRKLMDCITFIIKLK